MNGLTPVCKDSHLTLQGNFFSQRSKIIVEDICDFFLGFFLATDSCLKPLHSKTLLFKLIYNKKIILYEKQKGHPDY